MLPRCGASSSRRFLAPATGLAPRNADRLGHGEDHACSGRDVEIRTVVLSVCVAARGTAHDPDDAAERTTGILLVETFARTDLSIFRCALTSS